MKYTMVFALDVSLTYVLLLLKPKDHHNPMFRGKWTAPGGKFEQGETGPQCAFREFKEETGLSADGLRYVLSFDCNCDPTEERHEVFVYGVVLPLETLLSAKGTESEIVCSFRVLPLNSVWHTAPLLELVTGRMKQRDWLQRANAEDLQPAKDSSEEPQPQKPE